MGAQGSSHVCHRAAGKEPVRAPHRPAEKLLTSLTERGWCQSPGVMFHAGVALWRPAISYAKRAAELRKGASLT